MARGELAKKVLKEAVAEKGNSVGLEAMVDRQKGVAWGVMADREVWEARAAREVMGAMGVTLDKVEWVREEHYF